jgi:predicted membrane protein
MVIAVIWFVCCFFVACGAGARGRSSAGWFFLSLIFSPLIGAFGLLMVGPAPAPAAPVQPAGDPLAAMTRIGKPTLEEAEAAAEAFLAEIAPKAKPRDPSLYALGLVLLALLIACFVFWQSQPPAYSHTSFAPPPVAPAGPELVQVPDAAQAWADLYQDKGMANLHLVPLGRQM